MGLRDRFHGRHAESDARPIRPDLAPLGRHEEFDTLTDRAYQLLEADEPDLDAVQACFGRAAASVPPGDSRAYALGRVAAIALRAGRPGDAVDALMSDVDWAQHVPASFDCLLHAAVATEDLEPVRWLAEREGRYHEPSLAWIDRGVDLALREKRFAYAEALVDLADGYRDAALAALLRGRVREKQNRAGDAIDAFQHAAELGSTDPRCFRRLTLLLDRATRREEGIEWCHRALGLELDAASRADIEKRLARLQSPAGRKREASLDVIPLYVRKGKATIERLANTPVALTQARIADDTLWGTAKRKGGPHLFLRKPAEKVELEWALGLMPHLMSPSIDGRHCLLVGPISAADPRLRGMVAHSDGHVIDLGLMSSVSAVAALADRWLTASRDGAIMSIGLEGAVLWASSLPGGAFAYHFAADTQRVLATHTNRLFELDPRTGELRGSMKIPDESPVTASAGPIVLTMSFGEEASWPSGLGIAAGRAWLVAGDHLFEVMAGPRLIRRRHYEGCDYPGYAVTDWCGVLIAFKGDAEITVVGPDGPRDPIPCPWNRSELIPLGDQKLASFGSSELALLDAGTGEETHVLEAPSVIRAVGRAPGESLLVAVGRDLLLVTPEAS